MLLFTAFAGIWRVFAAVLNRDVGWWLYLTGQWMEGAELYVDIWEVNPPMMAYLASFPLALGSSFGVGAIPSFRVFVIMLIVVSVTLSIMLARGVSAGWRPDVSVAIVLTLALLILPSGEFGQREHLMLVLLCPLVVAAWSRVRGRPVRTSLAVPTGLMAAIGIGLKPHFLVIWLVVELWLLIQFARKPWKAVESVVAAATLGGFALWIVVVHPAYLDFGRHFYRLYGAFRPMAVEDLLLGWNALPVVVAGAACLVIPQAKATRQLAYLFLILALVSFAIAVLQRKGWFYHFYPSEAAAFVAYGVSVVGAYAMAAPSKRQRVRRVASVAICTLLLLPNLVGHARAWGGDQLLATKLSVASCQDGRPGAILMLSGRMGDSFPFVTYSGCRWASPVPFMWPIHALYSKAEHVGGRVVYNSVASMPESERLVWNEVSTLFARLEPMILMVDTRRDAFLGGGRFPYMEYFSHNPDFAAAIKAYDKLGECAGFTIFSRKSALVDGPSLLPLQCGAQPMEQRESNKPPVRFNQHWFLDLEEARRTIEAWRISYNTDRPRSSLGGITPAKFVRMKKREIQTRLSA